MYSTVVGVWMQDGGGVGMGMRVGARGEGGGGVLEGVCLHSVQGVWKLEVMKNKQTNKRNTEKPKN